MASVCLATPIDSIMSRPTCRSVTAWCISRCSLLPPGLKYLARHGGLEMGVGRPCIRSIPGKPAKRCGRLVLSRRCGRSQWRSLVGRGLKHVSGWLQSRSYNPDQMGKLSGLLGFQGHVREDLHTQRHCTSQAISTSLKNPDLAVEPLNKT